MMEATLRVAQEVEVALNAHQAESVVIGAAALAVHGYLRATTDFDLAVSLEPQKLKQVAQLLQAKGYSVDVRLPDPDDPLGGVMDVRAEGAYLVQVVNFSNPPAGGFPKLVADSLVEASRLSPDGPLRVVDVYHLIVFKLYAGGFKSMGDIAELLDRNPELDLERLKKLCAGYRMERALDAILSVSA
jgi:hypothetical protein